MQSKIVVAFRTHFSVSSVFEQGLPLANLIDRQEYNRMNFLIRVAFLILLAAFSTTNLVLADSSPPKSCVDRPFDYGRLWKVTKAGDPPSYIFGTMHSKDPRILYLPGIIMQAFNNSSLVILETSLKDEQLSNNRMIMFGENGFSLREEIGEKRFSQLNKMAQPYGFNSQTLDRLKIWAAAAVLSQPAPPRHSNEKSLTLLDRELEKIAYQMKKSVAPLESMSEQLNLFDRMPTSMQIEYLDQTINGYADLDAEIERLSNHYLKGRLGWIFCDLEDSLTSVSPALAYFMTDQLIINRNKTMTNRMLPLLQKRTAFVAIGALHLPGKEGVLSLLQSRGYKVERKY